MTGARHVATTMLLFLPRIVHDCFWQSKGRNNMVCCAVIVFEVNKGAEKTTGWRLFLNGTTGDRSIPS